MACISKLSAGFAYDCDTGATGLISAVIINKEDIVSYTFESSTLVSSLTLASGAKAYKIDTPKRTMVITESLKVNEGAPNALSTSVTINVTAQGSTSIDQGLLQPLSNGTFVILAKETSGRYRIYGLYYGLISTAYDRSTADNGGWVTVTLSTPENVIGEDGLAIYSSQYESIYAAAVY